MDQPGWGVGKAGHIALDEPRPNFRIVATVTIEGAVSCLMDFGQSSSLESRDPREAGKARYSP